MKIELHIERVLLDGVPMTSAQAPLVRRAIEQELARLLTADGLSREFQRGAAVSRVNAGTLRLSKENRPARLGQDIARAVHAGIGNATREGGRR